LEKLEEAPEEKIEEVKVEAEEKVKGEVAEGPAEPAGEEAKKENE